MLSDALLYAGAILGLKSHSFHPVGIYVCSVCGNELFASTKKYEHSSPWPAFTRPIREDSIVKQPESPKALKVRCGKCNNGLGHEFLGDGPKEGMSRF
ncbi:hypothetical protein LSH36_454g05048 [Paralvinella palmiformis]|uniref:peptide-methionine (R)-S-oxide reductase n=1 Tax=Paralvinella palmiformis TaxID=53620 RepID=A0AAD9JBH3_9ANNE|nr:hypothetical protein LSH36_454g05048 [Paralvinella palmiformis]